MAKKEYKKPLVYVQKGNGKKTYQSPKATVYKAEKAPKANNGGGFRISARTTVMGAVSLLLVIGLIASVFFAYENSTRVEGEPFQYFSPARFLENISTQTIEVDASSYRLAYVYHRNWLIPALSIYEARVYIGKNVFSSSNRILQSKLNDNSVPFYFFIDGVQYTSYSNYVSNDDGTVSPEVDLNGDLVRYVTLPAMIITWNEMPDFTDVTNAWSGLSENGTVWSALSTTGKFVGQWLRYQGNMLQTLLPWNSVVMSNEVSDDETAIDLPWRVNGSSYVPLP